MQTVLITGGTGMVGSALTEFLLQKGFNIIILTRSPAQKKDIKGVQYAAWNIKAQTIDISAIQQADYILHLAGAGIIEKKWTRSYREEIINSRTESSRFLADTLKNNRHQVKAVISASAIGWYGADTIPPHAFTEDEPAAKDFLGNVCRQWENSIEAAGTSELRVCKLRTGIVLSKNGGALEEFIKPLRAGIAAIIGNGQQMISWIHISDLCRIFHHAIITNIRGSYNAVAPVPVSNKEFMLRLARAKRGRYFIALHVPAFIIRLMLGSRSVEVLKSTTVSSQKIKATGFTFLYPSIEAAFGNLLAK